MMKGETTKPFEESSSQAPDPDLDHLVREAVANALTPKQREAVELFFFEGFSQSEIARRLGVSQQVVQKRLYGVRRRGVMIGGALPRLREVLRGVVSEPAMRVTR